MHRLIPLAADPTAAQLRRLALDIESAYSDDHREGRSNTASLVAEKMRAQADLSDAINGEENTGVAAEYHVAQTLPLLGEIHLKAGRLVKIEHPYDSEGEAYGIYVAFQRAADPVAEDRDGMFSRIYIGSKEAGPLAQYEVHTGQWYALTGRGNHGKNYACGGNWSSRKVDQAPEIFNQLEKIMDQNQKIAQAKARLEAAKLMLHANSQDQGAAAHNRQAAHPIYDGQSEICMAKAATWAAHADITRVKAALVLAEAGL